MYLHEAIRLRLLVITYVSHSLTIVGSYIIYINNTIVYYWQMGTTKNN